MIRVALLCILGISLACSRQPRHEEQSSPGALKQSPQAGSSAQSKPAATEPTTLVEMPVSAYATSLALDDEAVYLMTPNAVYRLVAGQPAQGIELDLGNGPALTRDAFIYWHAGVIWRTPKAGGQSAAIAKFPHEPQYFVTSGESFAWVDRSSDGVYTIQSLDRQNPRVLVKSDSELSALRMIGNNVFFVHKAPDKSWRIGRVDVAGGEPVYTGSKTGPTPATLTGDEHIVYWDLKTSEIRMLPVSLEREEIWLKKFVCSPIHEAKNIYCGCVEGLFEVQASDHKPIVISHGRHETITYLRADSKRIVWTADRGPNRLAVEMLPVAN